LSYTNTKHQSCRRSPERSMRNTFKSRPISPRRVLHWTQRTGIPVAPVYAYYCAKQLSCLVFLQYVVRHTTSMHSQHLGHWSSGACPKFETGASRAVDNLVLSVRLAPPMVMQGSRNRDPSRMRDHVRLAYTSKISACMVFRPA
jgi:hypothetical protein